MLRKVKTVKKKAKGVMGFIHTFKFKRESLLDKPDKDFKVDDFYKFLREFGGYLEVLTKEYNDLRDLYDLNELNDNK